MRNICPFKIEKFLASNCGLNRECITSERKGYTVKANSTEKYQNMMQLTAIYSILCNISDNSPSLRMYNSRKGLVYISEYDIKNKEFFKQGLKN